MADFAIATELTQQVLEARRLRGEDRPCALDSRHGSLYRLTGYRAVVQHRDEIRPNFDIGDQARPWADESGLPVRAGR